MKKYDVYLASKAVYYKPYSDLQFLSISTYYLKDLSINFITSLSILTI